MLIIVLFPIKGRSRVNNSGQHYNKIRSAIINYLIGEINVLDIDELGREIRSLYFEGRISKAQHKSLVRLMGEI